MCYTESSTPGFKCRQDGGGKFSVNDVLNQCITFYIKTLTTLKLEYFMYTNHLQTIQFTAYKYNTTQSKSVHLAGPSLGLVLNLYVIRVTSDLKCLFSSAVFKENVEVLS